MISEFHSFLFLKLWSRLLPLKKDADGFSISLLINIIFSSFIEGFLNLLFFFPVDVFPDLHFFSGVLLFSLLSFVHGFIKISFLLFSIIGKFPPSPYKFLINLGYGFITKFCQSFVSPSLWFLGFHYNWFQLISYLVGFHTVRFSYCGGNAWRKHYYLYLSVYSIKFPPKNFPWVKGGSWVEG